MGMEQQYELKNILLADDDADHVEIFKPILQREFPSLSVSVVADGEQLIHFLHLHPVDLLFLDLKMPCKNGYECLLEIRKDPSLSQLPIVMYSSSAQMNDIQK